jgi:uncharacterized protein (DUF58 family)
VNVAIYPTRVTILLAAAVAPLALLIGIFYPGYWTAGLALLAMLVALCGVDALSGALTRAADLTCEGPGAAGVGETFAIVARLRFKGPQPSACEVALAVDGPVVAPFGWRAWAERENGELSAAIVLKAERRGTAHLEGLWIRFPGPMGLVWKQRRLTLAQDVVITPDIRAVREKSAQLVNRDAAHGQRVQLQVGEGAEFEALTDYRQGMDRRSIDWKTSARHTMLIAKEYRTERNNNIVMAVDCGRAMCEPLDGVPKVDRADSAALLTAFVALKEGDRIGLFAFDSRPRASSRPISGPRAFSMLQRVAAGIDYSDHETNYTLALATLGNSLNRRSLIVVFTEFADTISAELMLSALGPILKRHLVLFVVLRDEELEAFTAAEPAEPADVSRAVMAASLLRERRLVLTKLRHQGVHVIEAAADQAGPALVSAYLDLKRRNLL